MIDGEIVLQAAEWMAASQQTLALTGAGVSKASGIPDFRSDSGLWARFDPARYATLDAFIRDPDEVWKMFRAVDASCRAATPNAAHRALAKLERAGWLYGVVTQNIDGLHQQAGSKRVLDYHGNATRLHCLGCGRELPYRRKARLIDRGETPRCRCGNALKPKVVLFGEQLPDAVVFEAQSWLQQTELMLVVGTSAEVAPASELPAQAKRQGARVIEINVERTSLTAGISDLFLRGPAEEVLPALFDALRHPQ